MTFRIRIIAICAQLSAVIVIAGAAAAAELKVMVTGSMAAPLKAIAETFARATSHTVDVTVGITTTVSATLQAGDKPDLIEVTTFGMDQLERDHLIVSNSRTEIAHAIIGVAVRDGTPTPDISTPEALSHALNAAHTIAYVNPRVAGQVGVNLMAFLDRTGVAAEVKKKAALAFSGEEAVQKVAKGEADMALAFVSEILPIAGVTWVGPAPDSLQVFAVGTLIAERPPHRSVRA